MVKRKQCLICVAFVWLMGFLAVSQAGDGHAMTNDPLGALPVRLYIPAGQKPLLMFSTPCMELAKIDHGVGPLASIRDLMAMAVLESSRLLPIDLQPGCR